MFEEEIPIDKMCLESDYVKKQQQQKPPTLNYKLDGARLNWSQPITCPVLKKMWKLTDLHQGKSLRS